VHPAPDLAIEIDISHRSVEREPIYAGLGVKELWRFAGDRLDIFHLASSGKYVSSAASLAFPFLPMTGFTQFVLRRTEKDQLKVLREFQQWVRQLPG
jgi:hypothetical protein